MNAPQPRRQPQPRDTRVPEWLRRMQEGKHPAKDTTATVYG